MHRLHPVLPVEMTLYSINCVQDNSTIKAAKLLLTMTHIVVSPHGTVCESLVTHVSYSLIGPLFKTLLMELLKDGFIAAYFVTLRAQ